MNPKFLWKCAARALLVQLFATSERSFSFPSQLCGCAPPVLIADEPTGSLDSVTADHIFDVFEHLVSDQGKTIVMVTHDHSLASRFSRKLQIVDGELDVHPEQAEAQIKAERRTK